MLEKGATGTTGVVGALAGFVKGETVGVGTSRPPSGTEIAGGNENGLEGGLQRLVVIVVGALSRDVCLCGTGSMSTS